MTITAAVAQNIIDGRYGFSHGVHILADLGCPLLMAKRLLHEALN